ncbi:cadherin-like beta sandwich domain-containing protein, partial [Bacteroides congonensis]
MFQKNKYHYTASVANSVTTVTINATASDPNAKSVTGVGPVT